MRVKLGIAGLAALFAFAVFFAAYAGEGAAPPAPEKPKTPFVFDGVITEGEYADATKVEFEIWNKKKATVYLINSGKHLIVAFDVPDACSPLSSVSVLLDGKADSNVELANDDAWIKFCPEQVEGPRFEQLGVDVGMWDFVDAKGWMARANIAMLNRWQCEIVIDLDSFGVKYGKDAVARMMVTLTSSDRRAVSTSYPQGVDTRKPFSWTLIQPVPGDAVAGLKIELDPDAVTKKQKADAATALLVDKYTANIRETQGKYTDNIQKLLKAQDAAFKAGKAAADAGKKDEAEKQSKEASRVTRELNALFTERAQKLAALTEEGNQIMKAAGEERTEILDIQATLLLNLFKLDPSSYTCERGAKCVDYYMKAFKLNPNIVAIEKAGLLLDAQCIKEASQLARARLALEPQSQQFRTVNAVCDLRLGKFKEAVDALEALSKEELPRKEFAQFVNAYLLAARDAVKLAADEKERLKKDVDANLPRVTLETTKGKIVIELFEDDAPNTVKNFISLVEKKFYDGVVFHRVESWVIQTGDPEGSGMGGPGYSIKTEANARKHFSGYLGMARSGPDTESSQFYFMRYYTPGLDGGEPPFAVFGRVIEGMDVLDKLERLDQIKSATVIRKREGTTYEPVKNEQQ